MTPVPAAADAAPATTPDHPAAVSTATATMTPTMTTAALLGVLQSDIVEIGWDGLRSCLERCRKRLAR
jgi:hypothetical protein